MTLPRLAVVTASIVAAAGCAGSEKVSVPGADAVVTAPVASIDLPPVTDPTATETQAAAPAVDEAPATSAPATTAPEPVVTEAAPPSTTAAQPPETTAAPPATEAPSDDGFFRQGDEGPEVGLMQFKLSVLDYLPVGSDTGLFDQATENGLRRFQADYGLGVDGVFGPLTNRSLNAAVQSVNVEG